MNVKNLPASLLMALGGIFALLATVPLVCDFFPLLTFPGGQMTFLGTRLPNRVTITQINGWTPIGFAGYELAIFYMLVGAVALILAINAYVKFIPIDTLFSVPFNALLGLIAGILDLLLLLIVYVTPISNVNAWGFSPLSNYSVTGFYGNAVIGASFGPGFYLLIASGVFIILGGLVNFVLKPTHPNNTTTA